MESHLFIGRRFCLGFLLLVFQQEVGSLKECAPGIISRGYTSPSGDLYRATGTDLVINCTLHDADDHLNSKNIFWEVNMKEVNASYVKVLNGATSQLHFPNLEKGKHISLCRARNSSGFLCDICRNTIFVGGYPPENVTISCTSYDFINITCRWEPLPVDKYLQTNWIFRLKPAPRRGKNCTHPIKNYSEGCMFMKDFCSNAYPLFELKGNNTLENSGRYTRHVFNQYHNVILSPPQRLNYTDVTANSAHISWKAPSSKRNCIDHLDDAFVEYRILVRNQTKPYVYTVSSTTKELFFHLQNLTPFTHYTVEMQSRFVYNGYNNAWGEINHVEFKTNASVPVALPKNLFASIATNSNTTYMNVTLYWTGIPEEQHFGEQFWYCLEIFRNNTKYGETKKTTATYFRFDHLPIQISHLPNHSVMYTFEVRAANEVDESRVSSKFSISETDVHENFGLEVDDVVVQDNTDNHLWNYTVAWTVSDEIFDLTLYWCLGNRSNDGTIRCNDAGLHLQDRISSNEPNYTLSLPTRIPSAYFFGIAAADHQKSQRIIWSPCNILSSSKPRSPQVFVNDTESTWIYLMWNPLKCEEKAVGIVDYKVYVRNTNGKDIEGSPFSVGKNETSYNVTGLKSNTVYKYDVRAHTRSGESPEEMREVPTKLSSRSEDRSIYLYIIIPIALALLGALIIVGRYTYKWFGKKLKEIVIQPPRKLADENYDEGHMTTGSVYIESETVVDKNFKLSVLSKTSTITKEEGHKNRVSSASSGFQDDSSLSSPGSSPGSGSVFKFDDQEFSTNSGKEVSPYLLMRGSVSEDVDKNPTVYSTVGFCENPTPTSELPIRIPIYSPIYAVVGRKSPELTSKHPIPRNPKEVIWSLSTINEDSVESHLKDAQGKFGNGDLTDRLSDSSQVGSTRSLNFGDNSGYAQFATTLAVAELPLSGPTRNEPCENATNKLGYVIVTAAEDQSLSSPYSSYEPQSNPNNCSGYQKMCLAIQEPVTHQLVPDAPNEIRANNYKCVTDSNLVSPYVAINNLPSCYKSSVTNVSNSGCEPQNTTYVNVNGSTDVSTVTPSVPLSNGYVTATNLVI